MKYFRRAIIVLVTTVVAACERPKAPPLAESTRARPMTPADSVVAATTKNWDVSAGPVLLVAASTASQAFIVLPDSANAAGQLGNIPRSASVTLFGRGGTVQTA